MTYKPSKKPRQPTVAETLRAIEEQSEYRRTRAGPLILLYASVLVVAVLVSIVQVNLDTPQPAQRAAPAPAVAANPAAPDPIAQRAFEATLARLHSGAAADPDAQERARTYRSQLAKTIGEAGLDLEIEQFECGPQLCAAWLLGDGAAYDRLNAQLLATPTAPLRGMAAVATPPGPGRHPLLMSIDAPADAAKAPAADPGRP